MPWNHLLVAGITERGVSLVTSRGGVTGTSGNSVENNITSLSSGTSEEVTGDGEIGVVKGGGDVRYICCDCSERE